MPEALHPGEPHCATSCVVIAESIGTLLRTLHADQSWNSVVSSAIIDRLQHVDSLTNLLSHQCHESVGGESDVLNADNDVLDADSCDKTVTVTDDVIETVSRKDGPPGRFF